MQPQFVQWPKQFFDPAILNKKYEPYISAAHARNVQRLGSPSSHFAWFERSPSFILLPIMYLYLADMLGEINDDILDYLPNILLAMEICAIMDDCTDETPMRSGLPSFPEQYGFAAIAPFIAGLTSFCMEAHNQWPALRSLLGTMLYRLGVGELHEIEYRFTVNGYWENLRNRYSEVTPAIDYAFGSVCDLLGIARFPQESLERFACIFQDVDDVINIMENRHQVGENSDLAKGILTHPIITFMDASPANVLRVEEFWQQPSLTELEALYAEIMQIGVPATLAKIQADAARAVEVVPAEYRPFMQAMVDMFVRRVYPRQN